MKNFKRKCNLKRLGGMTNIVHLVEIDNTNLIVRISKKEEDYINRTLNIIMQWRQDGLEYQQKLYGRC